MNNIVQLSCLFSKWQRLLSIFGLRLSVFFTVPVPLFGKPSQLPLLSNLSHLKKLLTLKFNLEIPLSLRVYFYKLSPDDTIEP